MSGVYMYSNVWSYGPVSGRVFENESGTKEVVGPLICRVDTEAKLKALLQRWPEAAKQEMSIRLAGGLGVE